jgi:hypothetical protein
MCWHTPQIGCHLHGEGSETCHGLFNDDTDALKGKKGIKMEFLNEDSLGSWEARPIHHPYGLRSKSSHLSSLSKMSSVGVFPQPDPYTQHRARASTTTTAMSGDVPLGVAYTTSSIEESRFKEQNGKHHDAARNRNSVHRKKSKLEDQMPSVFHGANTIEGAHTRMKIKNEIM